jgi:hypothetical protein
MVGSDASACDVIPFKFLLPLDRSVVIYWQGKESRAIYLCGPFQEEKKEPSKERALSLTEHNIVLV